MSETSHLIVRLHLRSQGASAACVAERQSTTRGNKDGLFTSFFLFLCLVRVVVYLERCGVVILYPGIMMLTLECISMKLIKYTWFIYLFP